MKVVTLRQDLLQLKQEKVSTPLPSNEGRDKKKNASSIATTPVSTPLPSNEGRDLRFEDRK